MTGFKTSNSHGFAPVKYWIDKEGTVHDIGRMDGSYIVNILNYNRRELNIFSNSWSSDRRRQFSWVEEEAAKRMLAPVEPPRPKKPEESYVELFL